MANADRVILWIRKMVNFCPKDAKRVSVQGWFQLLNADKTILWIKQMVD